MVRTPTRDGDRGSGPPGGTIRRQRTSTASSTGPALGAAVTPVAVPLPVRTILGQVSKPTVRWKKASRRRWSGVAGGSGGVATDADRASAGRTLGPGRWAHRSTSRSGSAVSSRYPFPASPNGWFSVGAGADLAPGDVEPVSYLGRELVLFRGEDGVARVFDAHCPHLGAHLGVGGRVCGDGIACPFHGWRFDGDGRLTEVPGLDRTPRASAQAWPVCERNGRIFVWHHVGGAPPSYEVITYRTEESKWTAWRANSY